MKICAVTGTFDPLTLGHKEIVEQAQNVFDKVYVLMLVNEQKVTLFSKDIRLKILKEHFSRFERIEIESFDGLAVDFCKKNNVNYLVRGVRNKFDFEYEQEMAKANMLLGNIPTMFFYSTLNEISSTCARRMIVEKKSLKGIVPDDVIDLLIKGAMYGKY